MYIGRYILELSLNEKSQNSKLKVLKICYNTHKS